MSHGKNEIIGLLSVLSLFVFGSCGTPYRVSYYVKVKESNMIVLKGNYDGFWSHLSGGKEAHPNNDFGPYIILNYARWDSGTDCLTTYYSHHIWDRDEIGEWYLIRDTIVLVPRDCFCLDMDKSFVLEKNDSSFVKKLIVEGNTIRDVTIYPGDITVSPRDQDLKFSGQEVWDYYKTTKYVIHKNAKKLKQLIKYSVNKPDSVYFVER